MRPRRKKKKINVETSAHRPYLAAVPGLLQVLAECLLKGHFVRRLDARVEQLVQGQQHRHHRVHIPQGENETRESKTMTTISQRRGGGGGRRRRRRRRRRKRTISK
jgi:hypothetical protein